MEPQAYLLVALSDTDITMEEDYTLQDFYAIVVTLGGSIGIFIGWSFYELVKLVAKWMGRLAIIGGKGQH